MRAEAKIESSFPWDSAIDNTGYRRRKDLGYLRTHFPDRPGLFWLILCAVPSQLPGTDRKF